MRKTKEQNLYQEKKLSQVLHETISLIIGHKYIMWATLVVTRLWEMRMGMIVGSNKQQFAKRLNFRRLT